MWSSIAHYNLSGDRQPSGSGLILLDGHRLHAGPCVTVQFVYRNCASETENCSKAKYVARGFLLLRPALRASKRHRTASGVRHLKIYR